MPHAPPPCACWSAQDKAQSVVSPASAVHFRFFMPQDETCSCTKLQMQSVLPHVLQITQVGCVIRSLPCISWPHICKPHMLSGSHASAVLARVFCWTDIILHVLTGNLLILRARTTRFWSSEASRRRPTAWHLMAWCSITPTSGYTRPSLSDHFAAQCMLGLHLHSYIKPCL